MIADDPHPRGIVSSKAMFHLPDLIPLGGLTITPNCEARIILPRNLLNLGTEWIFRVNADSHHQFSTSLLLILSYSLAVRRWNFK